MVVSSEFNLIFLEFQQNASGLKATNIALFLALKSKFLSVYALCGFANFTTIAIQVGGIGSIAPSRRKDLARLGIKSLIGGTLTCLMTACIAGVLI